MYFGNFLEVRKYADKCAVSQRRRKRLIKSISRQMTGYRIKNIGVFEEVLLFKNNDTSLKTE